MNDELFPIHWKLLLSLIYAYEATAPSTGLALWLCRYVYTTTYNLAYREFPDRQIILESQDKEIGKFHVIQERQVTYIEAPILW